MPRSEIAEPTLSTDGIRSRCQTLARRLCASLGRPAARVFLDPVITDVRAALSLVGLDTERVERNRGGPHFVVAMTELDNDVWFWLGYRETWSKEPGERSFRFADAGLTLHVGRMGALAKPQVLRSEWVGERSAGFAAEAAHPHWQLDVLESARSLRQAGRPARFDPGDAEAAVAEFDAQVGDQDVDVLGGLTLERMHLASAAHWWLAQGQGTIHAPKTVVELDRWLFNTLASLNREARRCVIVAIAA